MPLTKNDHLREICNSITTQKNAKAYFKLERRSPIFGKFVMLNDAKELLQKNMVRFVTEARREQFEESRNPGLTKIYVLNDFLMIKIVQP